MSQTVIFSMVNGTLYPEISSSLPDRDDAIAIAQEMVLEDLILPCDDDYEVSSVWYEIGDGESGMDFYFSCDQLVKWEANGCFLNRVESSGYAAEQISSNTFYLNADEVNEDDVDEDEEI